MAEMAEMGVPREKMIMAVKGEMCKMVAHIFNWLNVVFV